MKKRICKIQQMLNVLRDHPASRHEFTSILLYSVKCVFTTKLYRFQTKKMFRLLNGTQTDGYLPPESIQ